MRDKETAAHVTTLYHLVVTRRQFRVHRSSLESIDTKGKEYTSHGFTESQQHNRSVGIGNSQRKNGKAAESDMKLERGPRNTAMGTLYLRTVAQHCLAEEPPAAPEGRLERATTTVDSSAGIVKELAY